MSSKFVEMYDGNKEKFTDRRIYKMYNSDCFHCVFLSNKPCDISLREPRDSHGNLLCLREISAWVILGVLRRTLNQSGLGDSIKLVG
jgi:hypothetical protein